MLLLTVLGTFATHADAQLFDRLSNPQITVTLNHPPGLGLKVSRVAIARATGEKADQVADAITSDFVSSNLEVLDRQHLSATLAEHRLDASGYVDQQTAMQMGKFLGSTALIFINVQRATTEQQRLRDQVRDSRNYVHNRFISRTRAFVKVSVQTIDLTTGRTFQSKVFEASPSRENAILDQGWPEFPSDFDVLDLAIQMVVADVHKQFLPWTEQRKVFFFDDKECGLKTAYNLLKAGDLEGATTQSQQNVEACRALPKPDDKKLSHSLYNAGMTAFLAGDLSTASGFLSEAQRVKASGIIEETMAEVNKARMLEAEAARVEQRTAQAEAARAGSSTATPQGPQGASPSAAAPTTPRATAPRATAGSTTPGTKPAVPASSAGTQASATPAERLKALNELFKQGLITKDEYEKKKAEILKEM